MSTALSRLRANMLYWLWGQFALRWWLRQQADALTLETAFVPNVGTIYGPWPRIVKHMRKLTWRRIREVRRSA